MGGAAAEVSWEQVLAWRMRRQHLLERAPAADLVAVADRLCGLHAQVMSSVELALWARTEGLTRDAVRDALWEQRSLVKLWAMRRTLHVLPAAGIGRWLAALGDHTNGWTAAALRDPQLVELAELVGTALHGRLLTRAELADEVGRLAGSAARGALIHGSWGGYLKPASHLGLLCFGPGEGQRVRFTNPATWLRPSADQSTQQPFDGPPDRSPQQPPDPRAAAAELAARFLRAYGPAAPVDLGGWWGANRTQAARMLADLGDAVTEVSVEGVPYTLLAADVADLAATPPLVTGSAGAGVVRLLPGFDQWVVCATRTAGPRSRLVPGEPALDPAQRSRIYRMQGWVSPVVLVNGRMAGVWSHRRSGRRLAVEIEPFGRLPRWTRRPIEAEAERLAGFLGGELRLTVG